MLGRMDYDFRAIERRWQQRWEAERTFATPNPGEAGFDPQRPKYYVLDMFPYPSGVGLHVGHPLGYIATDIMARYKRMKGFAVLHPMGYDAFGLPAEQFAVETGVHPRTTTEQNIANMTRQLKRLGLSYDWDRCVSTTDPAYYRWTQWIFLQMYGSWFDPRAQAARPIAALRNQLESGELDVGPLGELMPVGASGAMDPFGGTPVGVHKWHELGAAERSDVLDRYRLAYVDEVAVNWCPALGTVLANEEVTSAGRSERGDHPVYKRPLRQWMLRITTYAERLLADLELVDWPEPIKLMQRNWIGRSAGAMVDFAVADSDQVIAVFTTRPDTLFGATYMVLAPEHPLVPTVTSADQRAAVERYQREAETRSDVDRMADTAGGAAAGAVARSGAFTGAHAINPTNGERIPIWIADYVMMGYGTGAIMAVPAHDQRDFEFARQFGLPIRAVVMPDRDWLSAQGTDAAAYQRDPAAMDVAFEGDGISINSANDDVSLDTLPTPEAKDRIVAWLAAVRVGRAQVQYKLRDWLFSRQRYWGEPFPIVHTEAGGVVALDEDQLPVGLPEMADFRHEADQDPDLPPRPPLSRAPADWRHVSGEDLPATLRGCDERVTREFNTMPQWAGSCWYYLRFLDPHNGERFVGPEAERYWMASRRGDGRAHAGGVDLYVGGAEHAVLHLLYARFWHKVLYDLGHVSTPEPFGRLYNQGHIQAHAFRDERGVYVPADAVKQDGDRWLYDGRTVTREFGKMGKSLKNAVSPDAICEQYGCDALRLYEMYLGPLDQAKAWSTQDIVGLHRFLSRVWRNFVREDGSLTLNDEPASADLRKALHRTIRKVGDDIERLGFNTAIAALIELNNQLVPLATLPREVAEPFVLMLAPLAPHIGEQLWALLGHDRSLADEPFPSFDETLLVEAEVEYPIQVNGRVRGRITVSADAPTTAIEQAAVGDEAVQRAIGDKSVQKIIVIPGRMVNVVVR